MGDADFPDEEAVAGGTSEVTLAADGAIILAGGCCELDTDESAIGHVDGSYVSDDTDLLAGGFDRLADFDGVHGGCFLNRHDARLHKCCEDRDEGCNGEQKEREGEELVARRVGKVLLGGGAGVEDKKWEEVAKSAVVTLH